jgi:hypothetical protein
MDKIFDKERLLKWTWYLIKSVCKNGQDIFDKEGLQKVKRYLLKNVCKKGQDIWYRAFVKMDRIFDKEGL